MQQHIKKIIYYDQVGVILETQDGSTFEIDKQLMLC
jgi:hypothetical protein